MNGRHRPARHDEEVVPAGFLGTGNPAGLPGSDNRLLVTARDLQTPTRQQCSCRHTAVRALGVDTDDDRLGSDLALARRLGRSPAEPPRGRVGLGVLARGAAS